MLTLYIGDCVIYHDETGRTWHRYPGLPPLVGCAIDNAYYRQKAAEQGYGDDLDRCVLGHELCHSLVARALGFPRSPTLEAAARRLADPRLPYYPLHPYEEAASEALHVWARKAGLDLVDIARRIPA